MTIYIASSLIADAPGELSDIAQKTCDCTRLSIKDGLKLFTTPHEDYLCELASYACYQRTGFTVPYSITLHLYPSNICHAQCPICSFAALEGDQRAFFSPPECLISRLQECLPHGITQVHIVSGLSPRLTLTYYEKLFTSIRTIAPNIHIKALSAVEYDYLASISGLSVEEVIKKMQSYGLSWIPGGGAEIFAPEIRSRITPLKISAKRYLEIHATAHRLGLHSNATMLYGHIEQPEHILDHLDRLRTLQDSTHGFSSCILLRFLAGSAPFRISHSSISRRRLYAICRLMLDNIKHLSAPWNYEGIDEATECLKAGANHIGNVIYDELVARSTGAIMPQVDEEKLRSMIEKTGRSATKEGYRC